MSSRGPTPLRLAVNSSVAVLTLNRPETNNAIDANMIHHLVLAVEKLKTHKSRLRIVFLQSTGKWFSAGGDPHYFLEAKNRSEEENINNAKKFAQLLRDLNELPCFVVGLVQGTAMGGGVGLVAVCDHVIMRRSSMLTFPEVKIGVIPATISPYVVKKIGAGHARRLFMTGEAISAERALHMGLAHHLVDNEEQMTASATHQLEIIGNTAPDAMAAAKALVLNVHGRAVDDKLVEETATEFARVKVSDECFNGISHLLFNQPRPWTAKPLQMPLPGDDVMLHEKESTEPLENNSLLG